MLLTTSPLTPLPTLAPSAPRSPEQCLRTGTQIVCEAGAGCGCPLSRQMTDAERASMNDLSRQASRLATALAWVFGLLALVSALLLLMT